MSDPKEGSTLWFVLASYDYINPQTVFQHVKFFLLLPIAIVKYTYYRMTEK